MPLLSVKAADGTGITVGADILLGSVISLGLLRGKKYAAIFGITIGFIFDVYVGNPYEFSPLIYFLCAYYASLASTPFSRRTPLSVLLISAMLLWVKAVFSFFYLIAVSGESGAAKVLLLGVIPEYIGNIVACALCFAVMRIGMAIFRIPVKEDIR